MQIPDSADIEWKKSKDGRCVSAVGQHDTRGIISANSKKCPRTVPWSWMEDKHEKISWGFGHKKMCIIETLRYVVYHFCFIISLFFFVEPFQDNLGWKWFGNSWTLFQKWLKSRLQKRRIWTVGWQFELVSE